MAKLISIINNDYFEINTNDTDGLKFFEVTAVFESFKGGNDSIHLFDLDKFIADFDSFILDRTKKPKLTGTYDFELLIYCHKSCSIPRVKLSISNLICDCPGNRKIGIFGEFELNSDCLLQYLEDFECLT